MECWRRKKKEKEKARKCFLKNGNVFHQKLIADCNGISNPIRMLSSGQISKATNHFDPKCCLLDATSPFTWYTGVIEGKSYAIKRFINPWHGEERACNDIVLSARLSSYSGFLKLFGCCLEFTLPVVVFEDGGYRFLNQRGSIGREDAPWNVRLKISKDIATAITYLHTAFPRIIIHRGIKADKILLDKNGKAKLTDLSNAITLPEGKSWIEEPVSGSLGYIDPIYLRTGIVTEYSDVYSFGILMLVLLMGKPTYWAESYGDSDPHRLIHDYVRDMHKKGVPVEFGGDSSDMNPGQMKMFSDLALRCCKERNEDRPKMISVAKEIKVIEQGSYPFSEDGKI